MERIEALAEFLEIELEEGETLEDHLTEESEEQFSYGTRTYLVLTEDEADIAAWEAISQSLWAFNAEFLAGITDLPELVFKALQNEMSEDANETIRQLVGDKFDDLVSEAISSDGRGHFMSSYDGKEEEVGEYFIYRMD
jgi:hypothetical protein